MKSAVFSLFLLLCLAPPASAQDVEPLRLAIARLTHGHVGWIFNRPEKTDVDLVAIYEPDADLREKYVARHGLDPELFYDDLAAMLDAVEPEAVAAFGSIREHLEVVEAAAPRGIHVMVEKPLAFSVDHAERMADLARTHDIHLITNYETTWYASVHAAREVVASGQIGEIRKVVVRDGHRGPKEIGVSDEFLGWLTDPAENGAGALVDFGCYGANLITWLMDGEAPLSVTAVSQTIKPDVYPRVDDETTIIVTYPEAQGIIQASWNWPFDRKDMHVYGKTGYVAAPDGHELRIRRRGESNEEVRMFEDRPPPHDDPFSYLAAVVRGTEVVAENSLWSLETNLTVVRILDAARESARTGTTVRLAASGDYDQAWRPQFHFTPAKNWMNDPNGLVYHDGEYHLFYQYNPYGEQWGHMSWGHAVSPDLLHWEHLPVALEEENGVMIFSGSAVVDRGNTSGFGIDGEPPMVAIYTGHQEGRQDQRIAFSNDRGRTWTKYDGNPVLDIDRENFRDPKVFWYDEDERWIMTVALPTEHKVQFYASENLKDWTYLSDFGPAGSLEGIWECPDLFPLMVDGERRWVLEVDLGDDGGPRGSSAQYFIGSFDGKSFTADEPERVRWVDHGADYYAAVSWNDVPGGRRVWLGWMSNWRYAGDIPTGPWRGSQSLPRSVELERRGGDIQLVQKPVETIEALRGPRTRIENLAIDDAEEILRDVQGAALEIVAEFDLGDADEAGLKVRVGDGEETVVGVDRRASAVYVDRRASSAIDIHPDFPARHEGPIRLANGRVHLHLFVDRSSVEVFADGGATVITDRIFPSLESDGVSVFSKGGRARLVRLDAWPIVSTWTNP